MCRRMWRIHSSGPLAPTKVPGSIFLGSFFLRGLHQRWLEFRSPSLQETTTSRVQEFRSSGVHTPSNGWCRQLGRRSHLRGAQTPFASAAMCRVASRSPGEKVKLVWPGWPGEGKGSGCILLLLGLNKWEHNGLKTLGGLLPKESIDAWRLFESLLMFLSWFIHPLWTWRQISYTTFDSHINPSTTTKGIQL